MQASKLLNKRQHQALTVFVNKKRGPKILNAYLSPGLTTTKSY